MCRMSHARTIRAMERGFHREADWSGELLTAARLIFLRSWVEVAGRIGIQRAVGEEGLAGGLLEEELARAEEAVYIVAAFQRDEEELARA